MTANLKTEFRNLISNGNTDVVISNLKILPIENKNLSKNIILISARFKQYSSELLTGTIARDTAKAELASINSILLDIIDDLPDDITRLIINQLEKAKEEFLAKNERTNKPEDYTEIFEVLNAYKDKDFFTAHQQEILASLHHTGRGTKKNPEVAFDLFKKSAERNWGWGQFGLANMYFDKGDYQSCMIWMQKACENNVSWAFQKIADMYRDGKGVEVNTSKALEYYLKSAYRGVDWGFICLGDIFYNGTLTIEMDRTLAKKMYEQSAHNEHAKRRLENFNY